MHFFSVRGKGSRKRAMAYIACGLLLILADIIFWTRIAWAVPLYTPYANSVAGQGGLGSGTAGNAVGAPDGKTALLLGLNSSLTLDMGEGEEGVGPLKVYFGPLNVQVQMQVQFLDSAHTVVHSETRQLFSELTSTSQVFSYDWRASGKAYRYVRISPLVSISLGVDAVEALGFIGGTPTQDLDGDGIPDRSDAEPLKPNLPAPPGDDGDDSDGDGGGGTRDPGGSSSRTTTTTNSANTTTTVIRTITTTSGSGATPVVNMLPAASNDQDGDQMDDDWERANGLDPTRNDAEEDPDKDELTNLREYQLDTNPKNADTDGDGMPDGWEVENGLNAKKDDALEDPDGDHITNLGEYRYGGNPYSAEHVVELAAKINRKKRLWAWVVFAGLLLLAAALLLRGLRSVTKKQHEKHKHSKKSGSSSIKGVLPPR